MSKMSKKIKYEVDFILDAFDLERGTKCALLDKWLIHDTAVVQSAIAIVLEEQRLATVEEADFWNEEELKMELIAFIFKAAELKEKHKIKVFYERPLSAVINEYDIKVICDCLAAKPLKIGTPQHPYFFLQEFKKQKSNDDAEAQMIAAMLVAQHTNANNKPIYGAFLYGKDWRFSVLHEKNYCISKTYDASEKDELLQIVSILRHLKHIILTELSPM